MTDDGSQVGQAKLIEDISTMIARLSHVLGVQFITSADVHMRRDKDCMPAQVTSPRGPSPAIATVGITLSSSGDIAAKVPALLRSQIL
eukprot:s485_g29.t2